MPYVLHALVSANIGNAWGFRLSVVKSSKSGVSAKFI